ncbi:unnamed protein product [Thelazia callipaeda]|uniref:Dynactin subunit 4 n=1 Tax=Thelazia callipaeda TaxID=103827 RepID=A0A158RBM3_THECL|nr:unnamed protein product [Thelazia callipaeda]
MTALFSIEQVKYECSCGEWESLNRLYFCRHCSSIRCLFCVSYEMDTSFCPSCLDNVSPGEARQKKNRCWNCYQCPICGVGVVVRASNDAYHLSCNTCRWTTTDSDIPDSTSSTLWPEYEFEDEQLLSAFLERMRNYAVVERADRERHKYTRRSSMGNVLSDRFGLQTMYNRRKAALAERTDKKFPVLEATADVPELDDSIFSENKIDVGSIATLIQQIKQPLANGRPLFPIKTPLAGRHSVRCKQCEHSLCKGEYSPTSIKFKIQVLAGNYVPDIRLSRQASLVVNQCCPLFLTVSNFSMSLTQVVIMPEMREDETYVKCESFVIELSIPNRDDTVEWSETSDININESEGMIVFRRRHRVGIRLNVFSVEGENRKLALTLKYKNSSSSFEHKNDQAWLEHRVCVFLDEAKGTEITDAVLRSKMGDEKFGHALHDDLTMTAICKGTFQKIKQKESEGNLRMHFNRRAWRYRIDDDDDAKRESAQQCAYVSRRTQLACKNYRLPSELTSEGFCEVHTHFFQQLAQYAVAEQQRTERFLLNKPQDPSEMQTLMTVKDWSCTEQDMLNDLFLDDDDEDPLKNAGVWTDEEVLRCQFAALERKLLCIRNFRKLIAEKTRRLIASHSESGEKSEAKETRLVGDERSLMIECANKKYHCHSKKKQHWLRKLKARLAWDGSEEHKLDYLKTDDLNIQCSHYSIPDEDHVHTKLQLNDGYDDKTAIRPNSVTSSQLVEESTDVSHVVKCLLYDLCEQVEQALESGDNLLVSLDSNIVGRRCSNWALPKLSCCVEHVYNDPQQNLFAPCLECGLLGLNFEDGLNFCFRHMGKRKQASSNTLEQRKAITLQQGVFSTNNDLKTNITAPKEQLQCPVRIQTGQNALDLPSGEGSVAGSSRHPIKYVVIDERDGKRGTNQKVQLSNRGALRHATDVSQTTSINKIWLEENMNSCARTRPFTTENFPQNKTRRTAVSRFPLPDSREYLGNNFLTPSICRSQEQVSKTMVHELLSGGPSKAAASASQLSSRRITTPLSSFVSKIGQRRLLLNSLLFRPVSNFPFNKSVVEAPETISLGSTSNAVTPMSANSTYSNVRPVVQRPVIFCALSVPGQPVRFAPRYIATVARPLPNWRNRSTISLDNRIRRAPSNVVSPMDYSCRAPVPKIPAPFRRRDERQFVGGNARSRLVAIDSLSYTAPRIYPRPTPPQTLRREVAKPVTGRARLTSEAKAPSTAETLETAAAVASIAADLAPSEDKDDEPDEMIGRIDGPSSSWQKSEVEKPSVSQKVGFEKRMRVGLVERNSQIRNIFFCREIEQRGSSGIGSKRVAPLLSRQSSGEGTEDGLAVLALAAASRAVVSDEPSPVKKLKYDQLGLEKEGDD